MAPIAAISQPSCLAPKSSHPPLDAKPEIGQPPARNTRLLPSPTRLLALLAASLLVGASAGFGAVYAHQAGQSHGPVLAGLAVAMALGLEISKPLALHAALDAARAWRLGQSLLLVGLAATAVAYSLTAELSLMAKSRADVISERQEAAQKATDARQRVEAARAEIARHSATSLDPAPTAPTAPECASVWLPSPKQRGDCLKSVEQHTAAMTGHLTLVQRHAEQAAAYAAERRRLADRLDAAEKEQAAAPVTRVADPAATALATYATTFGLTVDPAKISDWLVLIGVLALEVGSTLAGVLVGAVPAARVAPSPQANEAVRVADACRGGEVGFVASALPAPSQPRVAHAGSPAANAFAAPAASVHEQADAGATGGERPERSRNAFADARTPENTADPSDDAERPAHAFAVVDLSVRRTVFLDGVRGRVIEAVRNAGGELAMPLRAMAEKVGVSTTTLATALAGLAAEGLLDKSSGPRGTVVRLRA